MQGKSFHGKWGGVEEGVLRWYKKDVGACQKFLKEPPKSGAKVLFCGRGLKLFTPLRGTNSETK